MTAPAAVKQPSLWEDLLEIFYAPRAVFERRRETPAFGMALLVLVVLAVGLTLAFASITEPIFTAEFNRGMASAVKKNPQMTPEMIANARSVSMKFTPAIVAFFSVVGPLLIGLAAWLVGKIFESKAQLGQMMMVATYAMFPRLIEAILNAVQMLVLPEDGIKGRYSVSLGLGRFLDPDTQQLLLSILGRVDVFTIWVTFIIAVGISVMGKIPMARAAIAAAVVWILGALPGLLGAVQATAAR
ncbi:MAG TPA: YIP1 family protein [Gemmatimonadales bacterium]|nr:YIP1 family protein [Gemmatimonadales bacterium]